MRDYLRTETGGALFLLAATLAALVWANVDYGSYESVWTTNLSVQLGGAGVSLDLRQWVNEGLMALFFFVVGLEARREFDLGELRERRRIALPVVAALGGMAVPVAIYLAFNADHSSSHGWGAAMSTDTAFALGVLALVAPASTQRLRLFLLSIAVVDDLVALVVIAIVYTDHVKVIALVAAIAILGGVLTIRAAGVQRAAIYSIFGAAMWVAVLKSGIDPVIVGLAMGLLAYAYPAMRLDLDRATELFRAFREQPTPELAREARLGVDLAISPNERLQRMLHPWTSYVIVPVFALANIGIAIRWRADRGRAHLTHRARHLLRLRRREAGRNRQRLVVGNAHRTAVAGDLARSGRGRSRGGDRLHGRDPDLNAGLRRPGAGGGEARGSRGGRLRGGAGVACLSGDRAPAP